MTWTTGNQLFKHGMKRKEGKEKWLQNDFSFCDFNVMSIRRKEEKASTHQFKILFVSFLCYQRHSSISFPRGSNIFAREREEKRADKEKQLKKVPLIWRQKSDGFCFSCGCYCITPSISSRFSRAKYQIKLLLLLKSWFCTVSSSVIEDILPFFSENVHLLQEFGNKRSRDVTNTLTKNVKDEIPASKHCRSKPTVYLVIWTSMLGHDWRETSTDFDERTSRK